MNCIFELSSFSKKVKVSQTDEQACLGTCILTSLAIGFYKSVKEACEELVAFSEKTFKPNIQNIQLYENIFSIYKELYQKNKSLMHIL
ncbi:hypothetical protein [Tetragenococcus koreensis]|nr:hypothetical protein [Tetragenococcus koreensis]